MVQTLAVCGNSILREVSVMITSESRSIYPTTDVLHQAGPPAAPLQGRAFSTTPPSAPSERPLHQLLQHGYSISTAPDAKDDVSERVGIWADTHSKIGNSHTEIFKDVMLAYYEKEGGRPGAQWNYIGFIFSWSY